MVPKKVALMIHPFYTQAAAAFDAGVAAADPAEAVRRSLPEFDRPPTVIAVGKAAVSMARMARSLLGPVPALVVVTNPENAARAQELPPMPEERIFAAAHPIPDQIGLQAAQAVKAALIAASQAGRPVLCLISGGGSALLPAPVAGVSLQDKIAVNAQLLASGADIEVMNLIRQQLSELKGGGMLRYAAPSPVTALILSDVIGDDLRAVASGPTVAPIGRKAQARDILQRLTLWHRLPETVRRVLQSADVPQDLPEARNLLIGSNGQSLAAMGAAYPTATLHPQPLIGDVTEAVRRIADMGRGAHVFGGETTVKLTGTGRGGRNQDLALRLALLAEAEGWKAPWLYLQAGTDGRDGPTDAAGGVVCETTLSEIRAAGLDPAGLLGNNDAYRALAAAGGLHITGATGTNVADLGILIRS
ncbi:MAG: DUF4147 domain-containing protein [Planktomarina sp.]|nr:DUF4147 domain-containing protein [Planktomarina sp.]